MRSSTVIPAIAGIRKPADPNMRSDMTEIKSPVTAGRCCFVFSHCSANMTVNSAVIAKSIPAVSKVTALPIIPPMMLPAPPVNLVKKRYKKAVFLLVHTIRQIG